MQRFSFILLMFNSSFRLFRRSARKTIVLVSSLLLFFRTILFHSKFFDTFAHWSCAKCQNITLMYSTNWRWLVGPFWNRHNHTNETHLYTDQSAQIEMRLHATNYVGKLFSQGTRQLCSCRTTVTAKTYAIGKRQQRTTRTDKMLHKAEKNSFSPPSVHTHSKSPFTVAC